MAVFGVDFGNLASVVSVARRGGIDVITNEVSKRDTASMVSFGDKQRHMGEKANDLAIRNWKNTVGCLKRLVGVKLDSEALKHEKKFIRNAMREDENGFVEVSVRYKYDEHWFKPEQLIAMLFTQLRQYAEIEAAEEAKVPHGSIKVTDCVVSCPAYYTTLQRKLLHQALQFAELNPLTLINETTAAALDWGIFKNNQLPEDEKSAQVVCLLDIGNSATTATVASFMKGQLKVAGHVYDNTLGCRDFDYKLYEHYAAEVLKKYGIDLSEDKKNSLRLLSSIDKLKKILSANAFAPLNCEMGEVDVSFPTVQREFVEELWVPLIEKLKALLEKIKGLPGADNIACVEIIGGGSRIPCVKSAVAEALGKPLQTTLNASESIAKGCGIMGAMLSPKFKVRDFSVIDANGLTINLGYFSEKSNNPVSDPNFPEINKKMVVLKPGDACPKTLNLIFDRSQDFELYVFYEDSPEVKFVGSNLLIGKWKVTNIPAVAEKSSVKVNLRMNPSLMINVEGAYVLEEWEEEEVIEVPKKEEKKEEPGSSKKEEGEAEKKDEKTEANGTDAAAPMETDKEKKPETEKQTVKKKKSKKHECKVTPVFSLGHADSKLQEFKDLEFSMISSDRNVQETAEMKNSVEEYILSMRAKVSEGGMYFQYITDQDRKQFLASCDSIEEWLYGDGEDAAKDDYYMRMQELKKFGEPPVRRCKALEELPPAVAAFKAKAADLKAQAGDSKVAHVPVEQLQSIATKADEMLQWLSTEMAKCEAAPKTSEPTLVAATVAAKQTELVNFATPILNTPKPKPPKEEKKEEKTEGEEKSDGGSAPGSPQPGSPKPEKSPEQPSADNKMELD
jgi:heat shock protein 4